MNNDAMTNEQWCDFNLIRIELMNIYKQLFMNKI